MTTKHFNGLTEAQAERLAILSEECGELIQVIGKILRHGMDSFHPSDENKTTNRTLLSTECGDVCWAISQMCSALDIRRNILDERFACKGERSAKYLHHQPPPKPKDQDRCLCGGVGCNKCEPRGNYNY